MKDHVFKIVMISLVGLTLGSAIVFGKDSTERVRIGDEHQDDGRKHVAQNEAPEYGDGKPPTSGDHGEPIPKGEYKDELPDYNTIHNLEHGYVYISYQPDLPQEQIDKIKTLFFAPYSNEEFTPSKVIMAPRAANESPIIMSSWNRSLDFDNYDEQKMIDYYLGNVNKSPEIAG